MKLDFPSDWQTIARAHGNAFLLRRLLANNFKQVSNGVLDFQRASIEELRRLGNVMLLHLDEAIKGYYFPWGRQID